MGKKTPSAPAAPDPAATSAAQTKSNQQTALYNFGLNNPTVNTPLGSSSFTLDQSDPNAPTSVQNISLSPGQQQLLDQQTQQSIGLSDLANQLQGRVGTSLGQPITTPADINALSNQARDAYYQQEASYLDPQFQVSGEKLESKLANQGIMPGSEAYRTAMDQENRNKTFAYNNAQQSAITAGPQNAQALFGLSTAARDQPLSEFNALRTGSQPQMMQAAPVNQSAANPTDVAGNIWKSYGAQQNAYNQQVAGNNNTTNGLFGLAGSLGSAYAGSAAGSAALTSLFALSDIRLKDDVTHVGYEKGFPVYHFRYKGDPTRALYRGVMAQDVMLTRPDAVLDNGEYMAVNYGKLGIAFGRVH